MLLVGLHEAHVVCCCSRHPYCRARQEICTTDGSVTHAFLSSDINPTTTLKTCCMLENCAAAVSLNLVCHCCRPRHEMRAADTAVDIPPSENSEEPYEDFAVAEVTIGRKQGSKPGLIKSAAAAAEPAAVGAGRFGSAAAGDAKGGDRDAGLADDNGASSVGDSASDAGDGQDAMSSAMSSGEDLHADARCVHSMINERRRIGSGSLVTAARTSSLG
jgi:hypothetical protein